MWKPGGLDQGAEAGDELVGVHVGVGGAAAPGRLEGDADADAGERHDGARGRRAGADNSGTGAERTGTGGSRAGPRPSICPPLRPWPSTDSQVRSVDVCAATGKSGPKARSDRHRDSGQARPGPAFGCQPRLAYKPPDGQTRDREIPGFWPDPVPILSRSWPVSRQLCEFGLAGPLTWPHASHHQRPRGRDDPSGRAALLGRPQHLPHQRADRGRQAVPAAAPGLGRSQMHLPAVHLLNAVHWAALMHEVLH